MDTSEKYIRMCDHPLIQGEWKPKKGDWVAIDYTKSGWLNYMDIHLLCNGESTVEEQFDSIKSVKMNKKLGGTENPKTICLPRIDQLIEMVSHRIVGLQTMCAVIYDFAITIGEGVGITIDGTMEQLWLGFVMHELHSLKWDDEKGWQ